MSTVDGIAAVTSWLRHLLVTHAVADIDSARVTVERPETISESPVERKIPRINLSLVHITPNASLRNTNLPLRSSDGRLNQRPQLALDLTYLLSFTGVSSTLQPERLAGRALSAIDTWANLSQASRRENLADWLGHTDGTPPTEGLGWDSGSGTPAGDPALHRLKTSHLLDQASSFHVAPFALNLSELSRTWGMFGTVPYVLSVAVQVRGLLVEADMPDTLPIQTVREHGVHVVAAPAEVSKP